MIFHICLVFGVLIVLGLIINEEAKQKKRHDEIRKINTYYNEELEL